MRLIFVPFEAERYKWARGHSSGSRTLEPTNNLAPASRIFGDNSVINIQTYWTKRLNIDTFLANETAEVWNPLLFPTADLGVGEGGRS